MEAGMKGYTQGALLLASLILSAATFGMSVQSCAYKREVLPVRTYPLDFSCRSKSDFSAKSETNISLCMASAAKHSSQITWPAPAEMEAAQTRLADVVSDAATASVMNNHKQQLVVSCQLARGASEGSARGVLHVSVQSSERCLRDEIIV
jgi:hypothetical protein